MYRVLCRLKNGSTFFAYSENPQRTVTRFFATHGDEIRYIEVKPATEEESNRQYQLFDTK